MASQMSVLELKRELTNHGVPLPKVPVSKEEYEQLYMDHVQSKADKSKNGGRNGSGDFSSDDDMDHDQDPYLLANEAGAGDMTVETQSETPWTKELIQAVDEMTDEEIYATLVDLGQIVGPVVASTRAMYKRKLLDVKSKSGNLDLNDFPKRNGDSKNREGSPAANGFSSDEDMEPPKVVPVDGAEIVSGDKREDKRKVNFEKLPNPTVVTSPSAHVETEYSFSSAGTYSSAKACGSVFSTPTSFSEDWVTQEKRADEKYGSTSSVQVGKGSARGSSLYGFLFWGSFALFAAIVLGYYFLNYESEEDWQAKVDEHIDDLLRSIPEPAEM